MEVEIEDEGAQDVSGKCSLMCRSTNPTINHMHPSIYHSQNKITYDGKDELNLNNI